jgi:hypothetical protein
LNKRWGVSVLGILWLFVAFLLAPSPAAAHKIRVSDSSTEKLVVENGGRLLADYGSYRLYAVDNLSPDVLRQDQAELRDDYDRIRLNAAIIDTTTPKAMALHKAVAAFPGKRMHLIQFVGPVQPTWHEALKKTGAQILGYLPQNAYLVYGDAQALARLQGLAGAAVPVQWDGDYLDDYKLHPQVRLVDEKGNPRQLQTDTFAIQLVNDPDANPATLALIDRLKLEPVRRQYNLLQYVNVFVRLRAQDLGAVASQPDVISIQPYHEPRKLDERQDQIVAGNLNGNSPTGPGEYLAWLAGKGFTQAQFTASGFAVDISDSGIDGGTTAPGHFGLYVLGATTNASRVIYNRLEGTPNNPGSTIQGCDGHGNINAHIVCGYDSQPAGFPHTDSGGFYYGLGVCPFVKVGSSVMFDPALSTNPDFGNLLADAYHDGARISNDSWGEDNGGGYNPDSQLFDALVRDAQPAGSTHSTAGNQEMVIVFSAGNSGPNHHTVTAPGTAKNVMTVGAAENVRSMNTLNGGNTSSGNDGCNVSDLEAKSANDMHSASSRGPCFDGRSKPDLVAPGTHVTGGAPQSFPPPSPNGTGSALSCFRTINANDIGVCGLSDSGSVAADNFFPVGQQFFTESSGTSHAAPCVTGASALLRQYFINQTFSPPSPAMNKAYLMNSTRYMTGTGAHDDLWSVSQGMGELDLETAFDGAPRILRDQAATDKFTASGQTRSFSGTISDGSKPFRVTVAWTDAPGSTTGSALDNDLDLAVTVGGATYKGNVFSGAFSVTGGSADHLNNVESVFLPAGTIGNFTVTISAANINSDGVPGDADPLDQDFALVVYNGDLATAPSISAAGNALLAESCTPANGAIDPGETVTVAFSLKNVGSANDGDLVATLLPNGGVVQPSGPQSYGALVVGGSSVAKSFSFTANGTCGRTITNTFQLQDGGINLGTATFILPLGARQTVFAQNFDAVTPPLLPGGWTTSTTAGQTPWVTSAGSADTAPNAAFASDLPNTGIAELDSPPIPIATDAAQLSFRHFYNLEASTVDPTTGYDGGVLEIQIGNGAFADIVSAGGSFVAGGYDRTISTSFGNPLKGRDAWSGDSAGFTTTIVNLPAAVQGQNVRFRWRLATDSSNNGDVTGWFVDTITISDLACCTGSSTNNNVDFAAAAGVYQGLIQSQSGSPQTSGLFTITVGNTGSMSAKLTFGGVAFSVKGTFDESGKLSAAIPRGGTSPLTLVLQLELTNGTGRITGTLSDATLTSDVMADPLAFNSKTNPATAFQGYYTVLLPPNSDDTGPGFPQGNGYGTLKVDAGGNIKFSGTLGDGTPISQKAVVSKDGTWPVFIPLYGKQGVMVGWVTFTNIVGVSDLNGALTWFKPPVSNSRFYPNGFTTVTSLFGSKYTTPSSGTPVLNVANSNCNVLVTVGDGNLGSFSSNSVTLTAAKAASPCAANGFKVFVTASTGLFSGSFVNPSAHKSILFRGAILQKQNIGAGFFLGTDQTGFATVEPSP